MPKQHDEESFEKDLRAQTEEIYCRIGKLAAELKNAEETQRQFETRRAQLNAQMEETAEFESRAERYRMRRDELEVEIDLLQRAVLESESRLSFSRQRLAELTSELDVQQAVVDAAAKELQKTRDLSHTLVQQNVAELAKCEDARSQNAKLTASYADLLEKGNDQLAKCQQAEQANAQLIDKYTAIMKQQNELKQKLASAGPQLQIYGQVRLPREDPEEPYAVFAPDRTLLGTGLTQARGRIAYSPIVGSYTEVDVRVGGTTQRVPTWPLITPMSGSAPAPVATARLAADSEPAKVDNPLPSFDVPPASNAAGDIPGTTFPALTMAAARGK